MTKDDLRRYGSIRRELADITRRLHELEESKGCHGVTYGDSPHQRGEPLSEAQRYVEKKETLERLYRRKQCILLEEQAAVEMRLRYLDGMTCEQVCVELPCSWDTFHRWHRKALAMLE